jgi:hypothetical protein
VRAVLAGSCTGLSLSLLGYPLAETLLGPAGVQALALLDLANCLAGARGSRQDRVPPNNLLDGVRPREELNMGLEWKAVESRMSEEDAYVEEWLGVWPACTCLS